MTRIKLHRWDLAPGSVNRGTQEAHVAANRRSSDKRAKNGSGLPRPGRSRVVRYARKLNNGNFPGNGFGGMGGPNGIPGGLSLGKLFKHHKAMHALPKPKKYTTAGGGGPPPPKLQAKPPFKPAKAMPIRKISMTPVKKQPKPKTSTTLGPLKSAASTAPKFAAQPTGGLPLRSSGRRR